VEGGRTKRFAKVSKETKGSLKCLFANIRSIRSKIDELRHLAEETKADLILLTETWTNPEMGDAEISIEGFSIINRSDRGDTGGGRGGGIISYVRTGVQVTEVASKFDLFCQGRMMQITCQQMKLNIVNIYRPPSTSQDNITRLSDAIREIKAPTIIVGDFNFPEISWNTMTTTSIRSQEFIEAIQDVFLSQMVNFPTRHGNDPTKGNTLDLILCSHPELIGNIDDIGPIGNSDHTCVQFDILISVQENLSEELIPDFRKANFEEMREQLNRIEWDTELDGKSTEEMWSLFKQKLDQLTLQHIPMMHRRSKKKTPWNNQETRRAVRVKQRKYKKMKQTQSAEDVSEFKKAQKQTKKVIRKARKNYEKKLARNFKNNPKAFYTYISKTTKSKNIVGPLKSKDHETQNDSEVCDVLNGFFTSVFTKDDGLEMPQMEQMYNGDTPLKNIIISESDVLKAISKLKNESAPGPDKIHSRVLKELQHQVAFPLAVIYTCSLQTGEVVGDWKEANITPVFKKGNKSLANNYRPISLTSVPGKLLERILRDAIMDHLLKNNLIYATQHGFMPRKSTVSNLVEYMDEVTSLLDSGVSVDAVYIDYAKCFDKISHRHLLYKISKYGIEDKVLEWLKNWLYGRNQRVCLNGVASPSSEVTSSVIQGSILGPILFTIFSNDIDLELKTSSISKYADDSKVFAGIRNKDDHQNLQDDLDRIYEWSVKWKMEINKEKCHVVHFGKTNNELGYYFGGENLEAVEEEKDLGVIIHKSGKPHNQCIKAAKKANQVLGQLCRNIISKDKYTFTRLYKTYVRPHLEYAVQVWNPWNIGDVELLEKVQKRATRQVPGIGKKTYEERLRLLHLTTLSQRRKRGDLIELHKMLNGKTEVQRDRLFKSLSESSGSRSTRGNANQNLFKHHTRLEIRRNFFTQRVINSWNVLPLDVKNATSVLSFKVQYDKHEGDRRQI